MVEDPRHLELGERQDWRQGPNCLFIPNFLGTLGTSGALEVSGVPTYYPTFPLPCPTYSLIPCLTFPDLTHLIRSKLIIAGNLKIRLIIS